MKPHTALKEVIKQLHKEWKALGLQNLSVSRSSAQQQQALHLQATLFLPSYRMPEIIISTTLLSGLSTHSAYMITNAILPDKLPLDSLLSSLCAFAQCATAVLSPFSVVIDMENEHLLLRHNQLITLPMTSTSSPFIAAMQQLAPTLQQSVDHLVQRASTPEEARQMARYIIEDEVPHNV